MTMMDSDSESHDSDDGRRFRFEATRKDATVALQARNRESPHHKGHLAHRTRSRDRSNRDRRDCDRSRYDTDLKNIEDAKKGSKNSSHTRNSKTTSNHKEYRESKNSYSKSSKTHDKDQRNSSSRDPKDLKAREVKDSRDRRSREKSRDRSRDRSSISKHRSKCRERHRFHDQGRNHDRFNHTGKVKDCEKSRDEQGKYELPRKASRKEEKTTSLKQDVQLPNKILDQMGSDSESDLGALDTDIGPVLTLDTQVCREPNLSDFDIVSDSDKDSCDSSDFRAATRGSLVEEGITAHSYKSKVKKHISKQQYERLLKRQATRNRYHLDESCKVNPRNDDHLPSSSNSNPSVISDFLLGTKSSATVLTSVEDRVNDKEDQRKHQRRQEHVSSISFEGTSNCMDQDSELGRHHSSNINVSGESVRLDERIAKANYDESPGRRSDCSAITDSHTYGPALPPKYVSSSNVYPSNDIKETEVLSSRKTEYSELQSEVLTSPRYNDDSENFKSVHSIEPYFPSTSNKDINARKSTTDSTSPSNFKKLRTLNSLSDNKANSLCEPVSSDWFTSDENSRFRRNTACIIGPTLPMNQKQNTESEDEKAEEEKEDTFGPILPPYLIQQKKDTSQLQNTIVGPLMPTIIKSFEDEGMIEHLESDDENMMGPLPADHPTAANNYVQQQLERRAKRIKDELRKKIDDKVKERELWMMELPPAQAVTLGLGPRKFRAKPGPDMSDRSCWTDTPEDKARKQREKEEGRIMHTDEESNRLLVDQQSMKIQKITEERKSKKAQKSLLEIHQKKLQKNKKREEKKAKELSKPVRRPFDRDIDLQRNRLNEAQRKSILIKAQQLDDRFSRGKS